MSVLEEARFENAYIVSLKQTSQQQFNLVWQYFGTRDLQQDHIQQFRTLQIMSTIPGSLLPLFF